MEHSYIFFEIQADDVQRGINFINRCSAGNLTCR